MRSKKGVAPQLADALGIILGTEEIPLRLRAWDGSEAGPPGAPVIEFRSRRALRRMLWSPNQLGLSRAYVAGEIDGVGDLFEGFSALSSVGKFAELKAFRPPTIKERIRLARTVVRVGAVGLPPTPPPEEMSVTRLGRKHSKERDAAAISHHYDVGNDFYALVLGQTMVYSCAVWDDGTTGLDTAQEAKLDLVCRKLGLRPGMRVLDVGCGWGSFALHAAQHYGVDVVGVTLSKEQADLARKRASDAGLADRIDIRV